MPPKRAPKRKYCSDSAFAKKNEDGYFLISTHEGPAPYIDKVITTVSIDPGIVNCGVYICEKNLETREEKSLYMANANFCSSLKESDKFFSESIKFFDDLEDETRFISNAHYIVVESQMRHNRNTKVGQHLMTYFATRYKNKGNRPVVVDLTPKAKTNKLGCPSKNKTEYKKWCAYRAMDLLKQRKNPKEIVYIEMLKNAKKKDDMGDVICQYKAWDLIHNDLIEGASSLASSSRAPSPIDLLEGVDEEGGEGGVSEGGASEGEESEEFNFDE